MDIPEKLKLAIASWQSEVDAETVELIESGHPPYEAIEIAKVRVGQRRRRRYVDKSGS